MEKQTNWAKINCHYSVVVDGLTRTTNMGIQQAKMYASTFMPNLFGCKAKKSVEIIDNLTGEILNVWRNNK